MSENTIDGKIIQALIASEGDLQKRLVYVEKVTGGLSCNFHVESVTYDKYQDCLESWRVSGIECIILSDCRYPLLLREIYDPPLVLFVRGNIDVLKSGCMIGVVGARKSGRTGQDISFNISKRIAECDGCVVSGLALGIDSSAHRGALSTAICGSTVAVLGSGVDVIYPSSNKGIAGKILENGGAVISQFMPGTRPWPQNFLNRNRIIAGMSDGVVVVQAASRSGSLNTARHAMEEGREVLAVPGNITENSFRGCNNLIKQGAELVSSPEDVVQHFDYLRQNLDHEKNVCRYSREQLDLISLISSSSEINYNDLLKIYSGDENFFSRFLELELSGVIFRSPGGEVSVSISSRIPGGV